jgi:homoprotocatechuate degradation regulator HpaR
VTKYEDSLPLQLIRARDTAMEYFRPLLAENDITEQQWRIMRILDIKGKIDFTTLSRESCILSPSLTGVIRRLEKLDYVEKKKSVYDGRKFNISLTCEGQQLVERLHPNIKMQYTYLRARIGEDKYTQLVNLLEEFTADKESFI